MTLITPESGGGATITGLLQAVQRGDRAALDALLPLVYEELTQLARQQRQRWHGALTLNTTAVVHETYLKLVGQKQLPAESRAHFFAVAAKAMRHILCNYARDKSRKKRGGDVQHISLLPGHEVAEQLEFSDEQTEKLAAIDEALQRLERVAERQARIVECRFFGGHERRRHSRGARHLAADGQARLELRPSMAAPRNAAYARFDRLSVICATSGFDR